jgi:hypothetical protein
MTDPVTEELFQAVLGAAELVGKNKVLVDLATFGMKPFHEARLERAEELLKNTVILYRARLTSSSR